MKFSIIVPTYNRAERLRDCLDAVHSQGYDSDCLEVIVVDDGSRDETCQIVKSFFGKINLKYIFQENRGASSARNLGIKNSSGDILIFLDDDCIADVSWLRNLNEIFEDNPGIEVLQGIVLPARNRSIFFCLYRLILEEAYKKRIVSCEASSRRTALFFGSGNVALRRKTVIEHNLFFDEQLNTAEDLDLYRRLSKTGIQIIFSGKVRVRHDFQDGFGNFCKRYFSYGRGYYLLSSKWSNDTYAFQPAISIEFKNVYKRYGPLRTLSIFIAFKLKNLAWKLGYKYEEIKTEYAI